MNTNTWKFELEVKNNKPKLVWIEPPAQMEDQKWKSIYMDFKFLKHMHVAMYNSVYLKSMPFEWNIQD